MTKKTFTHANDEALSSFDFRERFSEYRSKAFVDFVCRYCSCDLYFGSCCFELPSDDAFPLLSGTFWCSLFAGTFGDLFPLGISAKGPGNHQQSASRWDRKLRGRGTAANPMGEVHRANFCYHFCIAGHAL